MSISEVDEAKDKRLKEIKTQEFFHETFLHLIFIALLFVICYKDSNVNAFGYQKNLKNMFVSPNLQIDFENVKSSKQKF